MRAGTAARVPLRRPAPGECSRESNPASFCAVLRGPTRSCSVLPPSALSCPVLPGPARSCAVLRGPARSSPVLRGPARSCAVQPGPARSCPVLRGPARSCTVLCEWGSPVARAVLCEWGSPARSCAVLPGAARSCVNGAVPWPARSCAVLCEWGSPVACAVLRGAARSCVNGAVPWPARSCAVLCEWGSPVARAVLCEWGSPVACAVLCEWGSPVACAVLRGPARTAVVLRGRCALKPVVSQTLLANSGGALCCLTPAEPCVVLSNSGGALCCLTPAELCVVLYNSGGALCCITPAEPYNSGGALCCVTPAEPCNSGGALCCVTPAEPCNSGGALCCVTPAEPCNSGGALCCVTPAEPCNSGGALCCVTPAEPCNSGRLSRPQRPLSARVARNAPATKGYHVTRSQSQHAPGPCHCGPEDLDLPPLHPQDYAGHGNHGNHAYYPAVATPHELAARRVPSYGGGTFPRAHPGPHQLYDGSPGPPGAHYGAHHTPRKAPRGGQGEQQLEGFHTLQYQRVASGGQQSERPESPSGIRQLVQSVQRLFAKSHSLEGAGKREAAGASANGGGGHAARNPAPRSNPAPHNRGGHRRSKSHDRAKSRDARHRSRNAGWWSSDDNLDSDSGCHPASRGRHTLEGAIQDLTLRGLRATGGPPGDCMSCSGDPQHALKMKAWVAMANSQAREGCPAHSKALVPLEPKGKEHSLHYLQVPSEEVFVVGGGVSEGGAEIPCRRMRSGSYIRAMGDDESVEVHEPGAATPRNGTAHRNTAPPRNALRTQREALRRSVSMDQRPPKYSCKQCANTYANSRTMPRNHSCMHMQRGESLTESVFGDFGESQAVSALDLPGSFRARSQSYVRAIQAGVSQDDDCLPVFSLSGPQGGGKGGAVFPNRRKLAPPLPPRMTRRSVTAQSSSDSTQEAYLQSTGQPALRRPRIHSTSLDGSDGCLGRPSSRSGYQQGPGSEGRRRPPYQHSNSVESLDGRRALGGSMRPRHSSSADNLLEGLGLGLGLGLGGTGAGPAVRVATLGKSVSLPHNGKSVRVQEECVQDAHGRRWRPAIAGQVENLSSETFSDSDPEGKALRAMQAIGVQMEDNKRRARFRRSCSVMSGMPSSSEREELQGRGVASQYSTSSFQRHASEPEETRTVHTQGQWVYRDNYHHANDPGHAPSHGRATPTSHTPNHGRATPTSHTPNHGRATPTSHTPNHGRATPTSHTPNHGRATPTSHTPNHGRATPTSHTPSHGRATPTSHTPNHGRATPSGPAPNHGRATPSGPAPQSRPASARSRPIPRDAEFFLRLLHAEVERIEGWCQHFQREAEENDLPEEALAGIRSAVASAQALLAQKAQQFFLLCQHSLDPSAHPQPSPQDLAELWDLLQLAVEEVRLKFQDLQRLKDLGWRLLHPKEDKGPPPPLPKKPSGGMGGGRARGGGGDGGVSREPPPLPEKISALGDQQTQDPHGRLLQAKHSFRQNSATESTDGMEIYIPEAQTRF
ncbi:disks large-associated protein 3-like [Conger conger]|uniref:disks large-associated protein 3-like n=1 Tax=Conger conger TaxID=82655 RepID=UPI002A5ACB6F|nr:disks large-associated protein 3-like [Conger conger]